MPRARTSSRARSIMSRSRGQWLLAASMALAALILTSLATFVLLVIIAGPTTVDLGRNGMAGLVLGFTYPIIGWLVASRRPDHPIGWILLVVGLSQGLNAYVGAYATYGLIAVPGSLPLADVASWVSTLAWSPGFLGLILLVLVFPDGRLPTPRWRPVVWLLAVGMLALAPLSIADWPYRGSGLLEGAGPDLSLDPFLSAADTLQNAGFVLVMVAAVAALASVLVRYRRSRGTERQQVRWFAWAAAGEVGALILISILQLPTPAAALVSILALPLVPIAVGVAILRYRLYEIDRIISRTIGYGLVTGVLVAAYAALTLLLSGPFGAITGGGPLAVALSTLAVAALFQPLRRRIQRVVDRRFDRARYDGERTSAAFGGRLRDEVDLSTVTADLDATVRRVLAPDDVTVWLRGSRP